MSSVSTAFCMVSAGRATPEAPGVWLGWVAAWVCPRWPLIWEPSYGIDRYSGPRASAFTSSGLRAAIMSSGSQGGVGQHLILRFPFVGACLASVVWAMAWPLAAQQEMTFPESLYPRLEAQNCRACHNSSGVASDTRLHFPESGASREAIMAFGLELAQLVDRNSPDSSLLLLKPTNQIPHTGGPLIEVGSEDERVLVSWVQFLASRVPSAPDPGHQRAERVREPLRRLTHIQYDNTVRDLVGDRTRPARSFPAEDFVNGYTNQASSQAITPLLAEAYANAAAKLARNVFRYGDENQLVPCEPRDLKDRECAESFLRRFGMKAFRRPLHDSELDAYVGLMLEWAVDSGDFFAGAATAVEAMLQSPQFLFLIPEPVDSPTKQFEIAARLSYALHNTLPDQELFSAAAQGRLRSRSAVEDEARRLLESMSARETFDGFFSQWMRFDRLLSSVKDRNRFRDYDQQVAESMAEESRMLFRHLVWKDIDFREFFGADYTFVDDFLTRLYAMPDPQVPFGKTPYPEGSARGGILGHGTFLAQTGKPVHTSPTERGLFVREHFLCQSIPPPPPGVDASLPPLSLGARPMTVREVMQELHASEKACASCHRLVDPIGFGFEHFDTVGAFRETEPVRVDPTPQQERQGMKAETHELPIDSEGYIAGIEDSSFTSPREAGSILAHSETCHKCVVKQLFRYVFGRHETRLDTPTIERAYNRFEHSGFLYRELVLALVVSEEYLGVDWSD